MTKQKLRFISEKLLLYNLIYFVVIIRILKIKVCAFKYRLKKKKKQKKSGRKTTDVDEK